jgi:hypothetical protein
MKTKATLIAVLLAATGTTWANGGIDINNVDVSNIQPTQAEVTPIIAQGPLDAFDVEVKSNDEVDTSALKQNYDGNS